MHRYSYVPAMLLAVACIDAGPTNEEPSIGVLQSALSTDSAEGRDQRDELRSSREGEGSRHRHGRRRHRRPPPRCEEADAGSPISEVAESCCGVPGDRGNELGVGKFCIRDEHCAGNAAATLCSSIENDITDHKSFYCTIPCDPNQLENICGEGASCICEEVGCACTPTSCVENPPNDCEEP